MTAPLEVPELVRQRAMAHGILGRRWLEELPLVVATLAEKWQLEIGHAFRGGTAAFVTSATEWSGRACVLKVAMPHEIDPVESFGRSVLVHQLAAGRGCAELIRHDESIPAMLLERLGANLDDLGMSIHQILETVTTTLRTFWQPLDENCGLQSGPEKAAWLADYITASWVELGRPCERAGRRPRSPILRRASGGVRFGGSGLGTRRRSRLEHARRRWRQLQVRRSRRIEI